MSRTRASAKQAGTKWESAIVTYLIERGFPGIERRAKAGANDKGDISGLPLVIEAKDCRQMTLSGWLEEARVEADNADVAIGVVWAKKRGQGSPARGYVVMDGESFTRLLHAAGL